MYLRRHMLFEEDEGVLCVEVTEDMEAMLLLGLYHAAKSRAIRGNTSPFPLLEGQDTDSANLSEELRSNELVIREIIHWVGSRPVAHLTNITIISKISDLQSSQSTMTLSAWTNLAYCYHEGVDGPHGVARAVLKVALVGAVVAYDLPLIFLPPLFGVSDEVPLMAAWMAAAICVYYAREQLVSRGHFNSHIRYNTMRGLWRNGV